MSNGLKKIMVIVYTVAIVMVIAILALSSGGDFEDFMFAFLAVVPVVLGACIGALLVKGVEKRKGRELMVNEIKFYVGIPVGIIILIEIAVMSIIR